MTTTATSHVPKRQEVDETTQNIARAFAVGEITEHQARSQICEIVISDMEIHKYVAHQRTALPPAKAEEIEGWLGELLVRKIMVPGENSGLDLNMAMRTSAVGWARKLATSAIGTELRRMNRSHRRNGAPTDFTDRIVAEAFEQETIMFASRDHNDSDAIELQEARTEDLIALAHKTLLRHRGSERTLVVAEFLADKLNLVPAVRPHCPESRARLAGLLDDESSAYFSLRLWLATVHYQESPEDPPAELVELFVLWDDQTADSAENLIRLGPHVVHTFASAAVMRLPRPNAKVIESFFSATKSQSTGRPWRALAASLAESWVAREYEAFNSFARINADTKQQKMAAHFVNGAMWHQLVEQVCSWPGSPLGSDEEHVVKRLKELFDTSTVYVKPAAS